MKTFYRALCGNPKFDVTMALNGGQFKQLLKSSAQESFEQLVERIEAVEKAARGETPFAGALDNPVFVSIVEAIRAFKPEGDAKEAAAKEVKKSGKKCQQTVIY
eukprot:TRINITY_DN3376_c0_g2_i2.p4 TRINITY_DN3376_c0_g2~~TRINITY_DN3376_c0_g2_i2.p4  ORF type:complete len:104 (-),score=42.58 TRINITY_DN3376_c0_g2_i2:71-382(-)